MQEVSLDTNSSKWYGFAPLSHRIVSVSGSVVPGVISMNVRVRNQISAFKARMRLPVINAPMFLVSTPATVLESCAAGVIGSLPTLNARTLELLDSWLSEIATGLALLEASQPGKVAPWAVNLIAHKSNPRIQDELELVLKYKPPIVILAWAKPGPLVDAIQDYGGLVLSDVNTLEQARKAVEGGVDGLVLVAAGAGGHTGDISPFAFVPAVREFFDGPIALGGAISDGRGVRAAEILGADFANIGTRFIAATECDVDPQYKQMLVDSGVRDIVKSAFFTGVPANYLAQSILDAGLEPEAVKNQSKPIEQQAAGTKAWKNVWSAGHGVFATRGVQSIAEIVAELENEYQDALKL
jgi:nitronate monooxygenase